MTTITMTATAVRGERLRRDLSLTDMAALVGCDRQTYHRWEMGQSRPIGPYVDRLHALIAAPVVGAQDIDLTTREAEAPEQRATQYAAQQAWAKAETAGHPPLECWWAMDVLWAQREEHETAASWRRRKGKTTDMARVDQTIAAFRRLGLWPWMDD